MTGYHFQRRYWDECAESVVERIEGPKGWDVLVASTPWNYSEQQEEIKRSALRHKAHTVLKP